MGRAFWGELEPFADPPIRETGEAAPGHGHGVYFTLPYGLE